MLAIKAKFDGKQIVLPEVPKCPAGSVIVVFPEQETEQERESWSGLSLKGLARAYGENEPDYSRAVVKKANTDYEP